jgi:L-alanine-DL-glutamate epimerase-like enolase superfamily enzyme
VHALSGIDLALWDIRGKALGVPVSSLLGTPAHETVRVYASVLMEDEAQLVADRVTGLRERGFTAVKLGWGPLGRDLGTDVHLATAAREAAGPDVDLMLDAGCGYGFSVRDALYVAEAVHELGYRWLEEPLDADDLDAYADLTARAPLLIAAGEQNATVWEFLALAKARAVDVIQPDLARCGGFSEALRIMQVAQEHELWCVPHAWKTGILKAASLHWNAVLPGQRLQEWCVAENVLTLELVTPDLPVVDGAAAVPTRPGLGVEVDEQIVHSLLVT